MYIIKKTTEAELNRVQVNIAKELASEKIIQELYEYIFSTRGKKTRALLCLLASKSAKIKSNKRIALASVIELLHTATLVHDDVVDESERRRGMQSVNQVWTNSHSVLIGDFIYSKAFILMVKLNISSILDELANATNDIARGEIIKLSLFEKKQCITLDDLLKISYLKTGRLFEASAKTGAMLASNSKKEIKTFGLLGKALGTAFQIKDDILDYESKLDTGKTPLQDFREGKITFPLYFALKNASTKDKNFLLKKLGQPRLLKKDIKLIHQLIQTNETQKELSGLMNKYTNETLKYLNQLKHHPCYNELLYLINLSHIRKI